MRKTSGRAENETGAEVRKGPLTVESVFFCSLFAHCFSFSSLISYFVLSALFFHVEVQVNKTSNVAWIAIFL